MTADALLFIQGLFGSVWSLFTGWYIPGTHTTPGMFFLFLMAAVLSLRVIKRIFGDGGSSGGEKE